MNLKGWIGIEDKSLLEQARTLMDELHTERLSYDEYILLHDAINMAENVVERQWTPCVEGVPELPDYDYVSKDYICTVYSHNTKKYKSVPLCYVRTIKRGKRIERWEDMHGRIEYRIVVAWMPLPEPYKE